MVSIFLWLTALVKKSFSDFQFFRWGHTPLYATLYLFVASYVYLSIYWSIVHHISVTLYHVIITFSTHVQNDDIRKFFLQFSKISVFDFLPAWKMKLTLTVYLRNSIAYDHNFWYIYVRLYVQGCLFLFFGSFTKFWLSRSFRCDTAKNGPNLEKVMSVIFHISGTIYHMIVSLEHMWKMIIFPGAYSNISIFSFSGFSGRGNKTAKNHPKISCLLCLSQEPCIM